MATAPTPTPENAPRPKAVVCPSCGSRYNPETRELEEDTQLPERIAELETELRTLREANAQLVEKNVGLDAELALARQTPPAPAPEPREKKARDFIVGER